jgi:hypothetical protein
MNYSLDADIEFLELETDVSHAYEPRTASVAKVARDVVAGTIGRTLRDVTLKPVLWLDKGSAQARPMWRIQFAAIGIEPEVLRTLEANLRSLINLGASNADDLWKKPASELLPSTHAATSIVRAAQALRKIAGGKAISPDGKISSSDFVASINLPQLIGAGPNGKDHEDNPEEVGEVMGYNRSRRVVHFLVEGHQECTDISMNMSVFREVVKKLSDLDGNRCGIWYRVTWESGKISKTALRKLQQLQGHLFAQVDDFCEAELSEDSVAT